MDLIQNKDLLESLSYLVIILGSIFGVIFFFIKYYKKYEKRTDKAYTGFWRNEGNIDITNEMTHTIALSLESKNRELSGLLYVRKFDEDTQWNNVNVVGKRFFNRSIISLTHVRKGKVLNIASVKLKLKKKEMSWKLLKGTADFFPKKAVLWSKT